MHPKNSSTTSGPSDREILSTRLSSAPRALLWRAWTEPQHLARWWGPKGFTNTFREFDPRAGGHWRFTMHGPDGKNYDNHSVFVELATPDRIVLDHLSEPKFRVTATFAEEASGTRVVFLMSFESAAVCAAVRHICEPSNEENFDRLEAELARMQAAKL
jgi:uncharacterized protein YndB with AHSA1/START domain